eukprot:TRINITY_DN3202_c1_g3_i1.p1 TRINITY_DN3202_c1_g3~~TRINITY_DN3202_c1_g3_i1.p1  ORF type:complete len:404 (+),score=88.21 TRINITY_DN3202_c1_g3_i1:34-1212(+)
MKSTENAEARLHVNSLAQLDVAVQALDLNSATRFQDFRIGDRISIPHPENNGDTLTFQVNSVIGTGSFGIVFNALCVETNEVVAIKKVLQDSRYKNRELSIMKKLRHPNIVSLFVPFFTSTGSQNEDKSALHLNLVMQHYPQSLYHIIKHYLKNNQRIHHLYVQLYMYQLFKALLYMHSQKICHRDIKPQNILINPSSGDLSICDFGSAKRLRSSERNVFYISSRFYRAPELIFRAVKYTTAIDIWSAGCILAELLRGVHLFSGQNHVEQLISIIRILGVPTSREVSAMNPEYTPETPFPDITPHNLSDIFPASHDQLAVDLLKKMFIYNPRKRITAKDALLHPWFDELRDPNFVLPRNAALPSHLFQFTKEELKAFTPEEINILIPVHHKD